MSVSATSGHSSRHRSYDRPGTEYRWIQLLGSIESVDEAEAVRRVLSGVAEVLGRLLERRGNVGRRGVRRDSPNQRRGPDRVRAGH